MRKLDHGRNRRAIARACYLAAILNVGTPAAYSQFAQDVDAMADPLKYGPFDVLYSLRGSAVYDDNIFIRRDKEADLIWTATPGIMAALGDYRVREENLLTLQYTPSFVLFTENSSQNAVDHEGLLNGQVRSGPLRVNLKQQYQNFSGAVVDVGDRVNRQIHTTDLIARYEISPKTSVELEGRQTISDYERFVDFSEWMARGWVDYEWTPLIKTGAGVSAGWVDVAPGVNQTYQQGLVRAAYAVTELVEARASAGVELRQFQGEEDDRLDGIFSLGATYKPLEMTTFRLEGYRRPHTSVIQENNNYIATGVSAEVSQVLYEKYTARVSGGYENAEYVRTAPLADEGREDNYFFGRAGVDWQATERLTVGAFYWYRENSSTTDRFDFNNHQIGINAALRF